MMQDVNKSEQDRNFKLIKLINGDDIICSIKDSNPNNSDKFIEVVYPLKMQIIPKIDRQHKISESLNLSHWVPPYTETKQFHIPKYSIILVADVSPGLSRYYEYVLMKFEAEESFDLDDYNEEDIYDELLEGMNVDSDSIH